MVPIQLLALILCSLASVDLSLTLGMYGLVWVRLSAFNFAEDGGPHQDDIRRPPMTPHVFEGVSVCVFGCGDLYFYMLLFFSSSYVHHPNQSKRLRDLLCVVCCVSAGKYELDSLLAVIKLSREYYNATSDSQCFTYSASSSAFAKPELPSFLTPTTASTTNNTFLQAMSVIVSTIQWSMNGSAATPDLEPYVFQRLTTQATDTYVACSVWGLGGHTNGWEEMSGGVVCCGLCCAENSQMMNGQGIPYVLSSFSFDCAASHTFFFFFALFAVCQSQSGQSTISSLLLSSFAHRFISSLCLVPLLLRCITATDWFGEMQLSKFG